MYTVILYYNFKKIPDPKQFCQEHKGFCQSQGLKGRVYIAQEGINGTLSGTKENIERYKQYLCAQPGFSDTEFKEDDCSYIPFQKLIVKVRPEIVALKASVKIDPTTEHGKHLSPQEWKQALESKEDYLLLDIRNDYEGKIGHFEGAVIPDAKKFYDFEKWIDRSNLDKNKKVLMYCTGGIRCEKFSLLMEKKGFKDVYQLHGGIINYAQKVGDAHYKGKCFVFDDRLAIPVQKSGEDPVSQCDLCHEPCDDYINCANPLCNELYLCCPSCAEKMQGACSEECQNSPIRRPFDPENMYAPSLKWYKYFDKKPKYSMTNSGLGSKVIV